MHTVDCKCTSQGVCTCLSDGRRVAAWTSGRITVGLCKKCCPVCWRNKCSLTIGMIGVNDIMRRRPLQQRGDIMHQDGVIQANKIKNVKRGDIEGWARVQS